MSNQRRREQKHIIEVGKIFMEDLSVPISKRLKNLRIFLRCFNKEKEKLDMVKFKQINGFAADDDHAKRTLVDHLMYETLGRYPMDDEERNQYTCSRENPMMKIGWRPMT